MRIPSIVQAPLTLSAALLFTGLCGCAGLHRAPEGAVAAPAPARADSLAYYQAHAVQGVEGSQVRLATGDVDAVAAEFEDAAGTPWVLKPAKPVGPMRLVAWTCVPAGAVVGAAGGLVVALFGALNDGPTHGPTPDQAVGTGAAMGAGLGAVAAVTLDLLLPSMARHSNNRAAAGYNRRLWRSLNLGVVPLDRGEALRLKLTY